MPASAARCRNSCSMRPIWTRRSRIKGTSVNELSLPFSFDRHCRPLCAVQHGAVDAGRGVAAACPDAPAADRRQQAALSPTSAKTDAQDRHEALGDGAPPQCCADGCSQSGRAEGHHRQGDRQGEGSREIGRRHLQPRALPAAEGRLQIDGIAAARREQARRRPAGDDRRVRIVIDRRLRRDLAGIQLSQPARRAAAPAISDRRHHRASTAARAARMRRR